MFAHSAERSACENCFYNQANFDTILIKLEAMNIIFQKGFFSKTHLIKSFGTRVSTKWLNIFAQNLRYFSANFFCELLRYFFVQFAQNQKYFFAKVGHETKF